MLNCMGLHTLEKKATWGRWNRGRAGMDPRGLHQASGLPPNVWGVVHMHVMCREAMEWDTSHLPHVPVGQVVTSGNGAFT